MTTPLQDSNDWMADLFLKRARGRRIRADLDQPPYITEEGLVLIDRRSHQDRRKTVDANTSDQESGEAPL